MRASLALHVLPASRGDDAATPHRLARLMKTHERLLREQGLVFANGVKTEHGRLVTLCRHGLRDLADAEVPF